MPAFIRTLLLSLAVGFAATSAADAQQFVVTPGRVITATLVREDGRLVAHFPPVTIVEQGCSPQHRCEPLSIALDAESTNTLPMPLELRSGSVSDGPAFDHAAIIAPADAAGTVTVTGLTLYDTSGSARLEIGTGGFFVRLIALPEAAGNPSPQPSAPRPASSPFTVPVDSATRYWNVPVADAVRHVTVEGTNAARFGALAVQISTAAGRNAPANIEVDFACAPVSKMSCYLGSLGATSVQVKTDAHGVATLDQAFARFVDPAIKEGAILVTVTGPAIKPASFQLLMSR